MWLATNSLTWRGGRTVAGRGAAGAGLGAVGGADIEGPVDTMVWEPTRTSHTRTGRGHSFGAAAARKSAPTPSARRRLPGGRRAGKGDRSPGSRSEAADARRKLEAAHRTRGLPCRWPGCTFGPQPETGAAGRGVGGRRPEPCCWGPIPAGVAGLPEWPLAVGVRRLFISMLRPWLFCMCLNS